MLSKLKSFLFENEGKARSADGRHDADEMQMATAALLIEAARTDGSLDAAEEARIRALLLERFQMSEEDCAALFEAAHAKAEDSNQLYGFTRTVSQHFDHDERVTMIEMLWEVVYADGELHDYEANLLRRVAGLLYVTDQESGAARRRALEGQKR